MAYTKLTRELYAVHLTTEVQQVAVDTVVQAVLNCEFEMHAGKLTVLVEEEHADMWRTFVEQVVRQMLVFGFALCRAVRVPGAEGVAVYKKSRLGLEVAHGCDVVPEWNRESVTWTFTGVSTGTSYDAEKGWMIIMHTPPALDPNGRPIPRSGCARAYEMSKRLAELEWNHIARDYLNSTPVVFTETAQSGGHGTLGAPHRDPNATLFNSSETDVRSWMYHQKEMTTLLGELSKQAEEENRKRYNQAQHVEKRPRITPTSTLRQLPVDEGRKGVELGARQAPPDYATVVSSLKNDILWAFNVPPQIKANNVNSERLSSADRLTQMVVTDFERFTRNLRARIQVALTALSKRMTDSASRIHMKPRMSAYVFQSIGAALRTDAVVDIAASVFDVDRELIDKQGLVRVLNFELDEENRKHNAHDIDGGGAAVAHKLKHQT